MLPSALGYCFGFSLYSLNYLNEIGASFFSDFIEDFIAPLNGNRLIVLNQRSIESNIPQEQFLIWRTQLARLATYKEIKYVEVKLSKEQEKACFENEDNELVKILKTNIRSGKENLMPLIYLYIGKSKYDSETFNLCFLNIEDLKNKKKISIFNNKKPKEIFTNSRYIERKKITRNMFLQVGLSPGQRVYYHDPHLLHNKQFQVLIKNIYNNISQQCEEFTFYTSDIDLFKGEDCGISVGAFQKRAVERAKQKINNEFGDYCRKKHKPKIFIKICQLKISSDDGFIIKNYASATKKWFREKRFEIKQVLSSNCSQTFLHSPSAEGAECFIGFPDSLPNHDDYYSKNFVIEEICLHGEVRPCCAKCR